MAAPRVKFATQVDPRILIQIRHIAESEGRQLQSVVDEALGDLVEKRKNGRPNPAFMQAVEEAMDQYDGLLRRLAE